MNYNVTSAGSLDSALNKADAVVDERRFNMKKRMAMTLAALALSVIMAVPAYAGTWKYVNDQWKYQRGANKFAYNEWVKDNGNWYYLDRLAAEKRRMVLYGPVRRYAERMVQG